MATVMYSACDEQAAKFESNRNLGHIFVHLEKSWNASVCQSIVQTGRRILVHPGTPQTHLVANDKRFEKPMAGEQALARALATSDCAIVEAGCQSMIQAIALRKPVLTLFRRWSKRERMHSGMIADRQWGWAVEPSQMSPHLVQQFLLAVPLLRGYIPFESTHSHLQIVRQIGFVLASSRKATTSVMPATHSETVAKPVIS